MRTAVKSSEEKEHGDMNSEKRKKPLLGNYKRVASETSGLGGSSGMKRSSWDSRWFIACPGSS